MSKNVNKKIKQSLTSAYSDLTPDRLEKIKEAPTYQINSMEEVLGESRKKGFDFTPVFAGLATAAIVAIAVLSQSNSNVAAKYAYIYIDVNPSIEIAVNSKGAVVYCKAYNSEGSEIVSDDEVVESIKRKEKISIVVENVIKSIRDKGYFSGQYDSVLVSCANASVIGNENMKEIMDEVQDYVQERKVCSNIVYENVADYEEAKKKADKYGISPGKANYVEKIATDVIYTEEELATKNIDSIVDLESEIVTTAQMDYVYVPETTIEQTVVEAQTIEQENSTELLTTETDAELNTEAVNEVEMESEKQVETESVTSEEMSTLPIETKNDMTDTSTKYEEVTTLQPETTAFQIPAKTVIKLKNAEYEDGVLQVQFMRRVDWSINGIVRVTSSTGSIMDAEFVSQDARKCVVKISDCVQGETYTVYFEGIKRKKADNYTNYMFTFSVE